LETLIHAEKKVVPSLEGIPETLLIPLYARARENQRPDPLLRDTKAVEMIGQFDYDFSRLHIYRHDEIAILMRARRLLCR
jgi:O-methyltransferase involved in polyketide biosynthesis